MESWKMKTEATYKTATPVEVDRLLAEANALRSAYLSAAVAKASRKFTGLFRTAPRGTAAA
ncbi:MAG: hypothetical protein KBT62_12340 [Sulfitobacter litoralis]|jgi:hypothetical protein|uniref:Uncharacterized protein n=3 Tax=root TaxID=1 RepID=A0A1H0L5V9_9RHOB|nr:hypothetical protein [Sulfitobacter litoralis]MCF7725883.1 hypothetical protein [Sulfitobacter sp. M22]MCF7777209.1 hypothetical protein [Sulfitobacter sp. M220]MBQ0767127.1 hypothetical protein [Sulfitobacter litoralis]MBQ0802859.1 hypothetical protein [Sulfitobacter litoralis]|tara:strand:+ start:383 stop:565 length:183 start_codon:yes stop_codon:yes gene_type:complete